MIQLTDSPMTTEITEILNQKQAAALCGKSRWWVWREMTAGRIRFHRNAQKDVEIIRTDTIVEVTLGPVPAK